MHQTQLNSIIKRNYTLQRIAQKLIHIRDPLENSFFFSWEKLYIFWSRHSSSAVLIVRKSIICSSVSYKCSTQRKWSSCLSLTTNHVFLRKFVMQQTTWIKWADCCIADLEFFILTIYGSIYKYCMLLSKLDKSNDKMCGKSNIILNNWKCENQILEFKN